VFWCGVVAFAAALAVGIYLAAHIGWPIVVFAFLGGMAAIFYEAPPIRWCYRGLGETVIALSYGPWMVLGSLYLHTRALSWHAFAASLVPGLLIMSLAVVNAIPTITRTCWSASAISSSASDAKAAWCCISRSRRQALPVAVVGSLAGWFPMTCLAAALAIPLLVLSALRARSTYTTPRAFVPAIRAVVACYAVAVLLFTLGVAVRPLAS
jgi:1,4-dihydroxy-2-naphthoate octaprenyltransferase